ncbi:MAG: 5'/3'-nucleotidase SurE [Pseudomonadota bacterium]
MRILIVNDDGINAPGLAVAEELATALAGPQGEIWVVAPENERSGASHAISYASPMRVGQIGERRYAIDGYPADCALVGLCHVMADTPPDLVISGVNRGFNLAEDTVYSGTVGAAMEAALQGVKAVALSQAYTRGPEAPGDLWSSSRGHGLAALQAVLRMPWRKGVFYNVNFPPIESSAVTGMRVCAHGMRASATFKVHPHVAPNGREYHFLAHATRNESAPAGTDAALVTEGLVTISPLFPQITAEDLLEGAAAALAGGPNRSAAGGA